MSSTGLEMRQNRFRPGPCPDPTGKACSATPDPPSWSFPPQEPHTRLGPLCPGFVPYGSHCLVLLTPPKINPSYGLGMKYSYYAICLLRIRRII